MQDEHPDYFDVDIGDPPRRVRHPGALLAIRPGDRLSDVLARVAAEDPGFVVSVSPPDFRGATTGKPAIHLRLMADGETIGGVEFASLPTTVAVDLLRIGMAADEMRLARAELKRGSSMDRTVDVWHSPIDSKYRMEDAPYKTNVKLSNGVISNISLSSDAWHDEIAQHYLALANKKKAAEDAERTPFYAARRDEQERLNRSQTMEDVENLLDRWAAKEDEFPRSDDAELGRKLAAWLRSASPDEWHTMASGWNWDNGAEPLIWIARQPDCDKATALLIYWRFEPSYYAAENFIPPDKDSAWQTLDAATVLHIAARWRAGFYRRAEIQWEGIRTRTDLARLRADETMVEPLPGRAVATGYGGKHPAAEFCC